MSLNVTDLNMSRSFSVRLRSNMSSTLRLSIFRCTSYFVRFSLSSTFISSTLQRVSQVCLFSPTISSCNYRRSYITSSIAQLIIQSADCLSPESTFDLWALRRTKNRDDPSYCKCNVSMMEDRGRPAKKADTKIGRSVLK